MSRTHDALHALRHYRDTDAHRIAGLMTGTSADAIDVAIVQFTGTGMHAKHEVLCALELPLAEGLRRDVLEVAASESLPLERLLALDAALGEAYAEAVHAALAQAKLRAKDLTAIGSHGQTVRHLPRGENGGRALTLQTGSAAVLAERTGVMVVSDFRTRDTAAGGEGAPLVPIADWWLFRSKSESRVLLNLGGMANVTHLPKAGTLADVVAFDTGPGNAVLDGLVSAATGGIARHDEGGQRAAHGHVHAGLLTELLSDPFFALSPPRSTGRERFGEAYADRLRDMAEALGLSLEDQLATAAELTAATVADAIARFLQPRGGADAVYVSGGGVRNATLMVALRRRLEGLRVERLDALGSDPASKEALAFAFLAHLTLSGEPGNVPGATGAAHGAVLGHITPGAARPEELR